MKTDKTDKTDGNGAIDTSVCDSFANYNANDPVCNSKKANACVNARKQLFALCQAATAEKEDKKKANKKKKTVKITALDCFSFRVNSDTHLFVLELLKADCTMKEIKNAAFNTRPNTFYVAFNKLKNDKYAAIDKKTKKMRLTAIAKKKLEKFLVAQKAELAKQETKKAA